MTITLDKARYLNLATWKRDGTTVETPVWFAEHRGAYYVFSAGETGKVRRLRNSPRARIAPCDHRGRVLGDWVDAQAVIVSDPREEQTAYRALRRKYGWQMHLLDFFSRLGGKIGQRAVIRIRTRTGSRAGPARGRKTTRRAR